MASDRHPDPERQRLGRLGGLTTAARGRSNTRPARDAWLAQVADEFGITDELSPAERNRRMDAAMRVRMARLARARWGNRKATREGQSPLAATTTGGTSDAASSS